MEFLAYDHFEHVPPEEWPWANFSPREMACSHTGQVFLRKPSMDRLQAVRNAYGKPMVITSAYRSPTHPIEARKKTKSGAHTTGQAFDVLCSGENAFHIARIAFAHSFTGIGVNQINDHDQRFLHLDDAPSIPGRPRPFLWGYC